MNALHITAEVAEGLEYAILDTEGNPIELKEGQKVDLKVGMNEIKILLYEASPATGASKLAATNETRTPVKVVTLNVNREVAKSNMELVWMILFFVMLGLALLLLLILLLIPKRKKGDAQQVILAPAPYMQPPMMQPPMPQQPQLPPTNGKSPVNVEVRITGDGVVQSNQTDNDRR